jgi:hypothetical protein
MNPRYEVREIIAEGGLGSVHRGWDLNLGREVAIKRVRVSESGESRGRTSELLNEAHTLSALQHPNIVSVYDSGEDDQGSFIVMELVKGETLEQIIERGALNEADFEQLALQALEGLIAAHALNIVHLDLKPLNIMVCWHASGQFQVKLLDFGLAQIAQAPSEQTVDRDGAIMGSVFFMAPEQFERAPVDQRTDLYALGGIFYHALTQQYPFQGETGPQVMVAHLKHRFIPLARYRPDLNPFITQWVEWLMSCKPADRPKNAAQALAAFRSRSFPVKVVEPRGPITEVKEVRKEAAPRAQPVRVVPDEIEPAPLNRNAREYRPSRPRPAAKTFPKWAVFTLPLLGVAILGFAALRLIQSANEAGRQERFANLVAAETPLGTDVDVRLLLQYLEFPKSSPAAAQTLIKLGGGDYIDPILIEHLKQAKSREAKGNLAKVLGMRGVVAAVPSLLEMLDAKEADVRKAAWTALGMLAQASDFPTLFERLGSVIPQEIPFAEAALASAAMEGKDSAERLELVIREFRTGLGTDVYRSALLRVIGAVGGEKAMGILQEALRLSSIELRKNACLAFAQWASSEPIGLLAKTFADESDPACRLIGLNVIGNLILKPGPLSQNELFESVQGLRAVAKDARERDEALNIVSRVTAPGVIEFCRNLAANEPGKKQACDAIIKRVQAGLAKVIALAEDTTLLPEEGDFARAGGLRMVDGALTNWMSEADWVSWLVEVKAPGSYEVSIRQSSTSRDQGRYEILAAQNRIETSVVRTGGDSDFKSFINGKANFVSAGLHKIWLKPTLIPEDEVLFRLQSLGFKKLEN